MVNGPFDQLRQRDRWLLVYDNAERPTGWQDCCHWVVGGQAERLLGSPARSTASGWSPPRVFRSRSSVTASPR
jgi:hypothetical protein